MNINVNMHSFLLLPSSAFVIPPPGAAEVEIIVCCDAVSLNGRGWSDNHTLQLLDPRLGNLPGVNLTVGLELIQDFSCENVGPSPQKADLNTTIDLSVEMPDFGPITAASTNLAEEDLAGFDGEEDSTGPSFRTLDCTYEPHFSGEAGV